MAENQPVEMEKRVLKLVPMLEPRQNEKTKPVLKKKYEFSDVRINDNGYLTVRDSVTTVEATNSL